jgi:hypothetical protein
MNEFLPVMSGVLLGAAVGYVRPERRLRVSIMLGLLLAITATILSGEYLQSWIYLSVDMILVAVSAVVSFGIIRRVPFRSRT